MACVNATPLVCWGAMLVKNRLMICNVTKQIGVKTILKRINLEANSGDLLIVTGPNGAGKTTLLRVIAGLRAPSEGTIQWNGQAYGPEQVRIGYLSHNSMFYHDLSVLDNLQFFGRLYGRAHQANIQAVLKRVDLYLYRYELVAVLSRGMLQRLTIARMLLQEPELILYDEPFTSLDSAGQQLLYEILNEQMASTIQIVITHQIESLAGLTLREIKLQAGRLVEEELHG